MNGNIGEYLSRTEQSEKGGREMKEKELCEIVM